MLWRYFSAEKFWVLEWIRIPSDACGWANPIWIRYVWMGKCLNPERKSLHQPTFSEVIGVRSLSWECWDVWRRHNHFRRFPKTSDVFWRRTKSQSQSQNAYKMRAHSQYFLLQKSEIARKVLSFIHVTHDFRPLMGLSLYFLGNCIQQDGNNSHFSIRREKLARKREPAWDRNFQPGGVRPTPKA